MRSQRLLTLALLGFFGGVLLTDTAEACGRCRGRGRTYHYTGAAGYWSGGGGCGGCGGMAYGGGYAAPAMYSPGYAQPAMGYAPQAGYPAPQAPAYAQPQAPSKSAPAPQTAPAAPTKAAPQG